VNIFAGASSAGISWEPLTYFELENVCKLRRIETWDHTTHISSHVMSCFTKSPVVPSKLNPYRETKLEPADPAAEYRKLMNERRNNKSQNLKNQMGPGET